jgi:hypothetical protein
MESKGCYLNPHDSGVLEPLVGSSQKFLKASFSEVKAGLPQTQTVKHIVPKT